MRRTVSNYRIFRACVVLATLFAWTGCTVHKQETPPLTGPSGLGNNLIITVSPDTVSQDGASQSLVQIVATDGNGQPKRNVSMRLELAVDGFRTDYGQLSARSVVTDANGRATAVYTAPPPVIGITQDIVVQVLVTPTESDFGDSTTRNVKIRVVPTGVIGPPTSPFQPDFTPPAATVGNPATFTAVIADATSGASVVGLVWDFGDGGTSGGLTTTHTYQRVGTYLVTLAILDSLGRTNSVTKSVTVGQGTLPIANIIFSPTDPAVGQTINFIGSGSRAEPGHQIVQYAWNFGDGNTAGGEIVTHIFQHAGTFNVTLKVTDDVGRTSTLAQAAVDIGGGGGGGGTGATASFTISPATPTAGSSVLFDGSGSTGSSGSAIVSYVWTFTPGAPASGQTVTRTFSTGTFQVTLTVTDGKGQTASKSQSFTVS